MPFNKALDADSPNEADVFHFVLSIKLPSCKKEQDSL